MQVGRYTVIRSLGQGGMAKVLLARSQQGEEVVLKVPLTSDPELFERLRDEARVGLRLSHPSVVETLDLFEHDGKPILVVDFIKGASLSQMRKVGPLPPAVVARIGRQIADGLATLHEATDESGASLGILHRDVTAGNILVDHSGDARLIDLGIARSTESQARRTRLGAVRGTLRYLAPELVLGKAHSPATDLWSLGVVLWEACLGRRAVSGDQKAVLLSIRNHQVMTYQGDERVDPRLHDAIGALLAPEAQRLQKARAAANIFRRLEGAFGESTTAAIAAVRRAEGVIADDEEEPGIGRNTAELLGASENAPAADAFDSDDGGDDETTVAPRKVTLPSENAVAVDDNHPTVQMPAVEAPPSVLESLPTRQMPQISPPGDLDDEANVFNEPTVRKPESFVKTSAGRPSLADETPDESMEEDPATIQMAPGEFPPEVQEAMDRAAPAVASPGVARPRGAQQTKALYGSAIADLAAKATPSPTTRGDGERPAPKPSGGVPSLRNPGVEALSKPPSSTATKEKATAAAATIVTPAVQHPPVATAAKPAPQPQTPAPTIVTPAVQHPPAATAAKPAPTSRRPESPKPSLPGPPVATPAPSRAVAPVGKPEPSAPAPQAPLASKPAQATATPSAPPKAVPNPATTNAAPTNAAPTNAAPTNAAPSNAAPSNVAPTNAAPTPNTAPTNAAAAQEPAAPATATPSPASPPAAAPIATDLSARIDTEQINRVAKSPTGGVNAFDDDDDIDWKPRRTGLYAFIALLVLVLFGVFLMAIYSLFFDTPPEPEAPPAVAAPAEEVVAPVPEAKEPPAPPPKKKKRKRRGKRRN